MTISNIIIKRKRRLKINYSRGKNCNLGPLKTCNLGVFGSKFVCVTFKNCNFVTMEGQKPLWHAPFPKLQKIL